MHNSSTRNIAVAILAAVLLQSGSSPVDAYLPAGTAIAFGRNRVSSLAVSSTPTASSSSTDFSSFADSLESDLDGNDGVDDYPARTSVSASTATVSEKPWQAKLDDLLDPSTNLADRQILLSELLTSNDKIRDDVLDALANRKVRERIFAYHGV